MGKTEVTIEYKCVGYFQWSTGGKNQNTKKQHLNNRFNNVLTIKGQVENKMSWTILHCVELNTIWRHKVVQNANDRRCIRLCLYNWIVKLGKWIRRNKKYTFNNVIFLKRFIISSTWRQIIKTHPTNYQK